MTKEELIKQLESLKENQKDSVDKVEEQPKDNIEIKDKTEENVLILMMIQESLKEIVKL